MLMTTRPGTEILARSGERDPDCPVERRQGALGQSGLISIAPQLPTRSRGQALYEALQPVLTEAEVMVAAELRRRPDHMRRMLALPLFDKNTRQKLETLGHTPRIADFMPDGETLLRQGLGGLRLAEIQEGKAAIVEASGHRPNIPVPSAEVGSALRELGRLQIVSGADRGDAQVVGHRVYAALLAQSRVEVEGLLEQVPRFSHPSLEHPDETHPIDGCSPIAVLW